AGSRSVKVGDDGLITARVGHLRTGNGESAAGCPGQVGAVEQPLVVEGQSTRGCDREGRIAAPGDSLVRWLDGDHRRRDYWNTAGCENCRVRISATTK